MTASATHDGTSQYAKKFAGKAADGHFREAHGLVLSSLGIGTYLGAPDDKTDRLFPIDALLQDLLKRGIRKNGL